MRPTKSKWALLLAISFGGLATAQTQTDSNPWNPANWDISMTSLTGNTERTSYTQDQNGNAVLETPSSTTWTTNPHTRSARAANPTRQNLSIKATSSGDVEYTIAWVGLGPAPQKAIVRVYSTVNASATHGGAKVATNGIGTEASIVRDDITSAGEAYWTVNTSSGSGTLTLNLFAEGITTAPNASCYAYCNLPTLQIADKAVGILPWLGTTYRAVPTVTTFGLSYSRVPNSVDNISDYRVDTVLRGVLPFLGYSFESPPLEANLVGNWDFTHWLLPIVLQFMPAHPSIPDKGYLSINNLSDTQYHSLVRGNDGMRLIGKVKATQIGTREGSVDVRVHPEVQNILTVGVKHKLGAVLRCPGGEFNLPPGASASWTTTVVVTDTVTTAFTFNYNFMFGGGLPDEVLKAELGLGGSWDWGETAEIAKGSAFEMTVVNQSNHNRRGRFVQRSKYQEISFIGLTYDANGFKGVGTGTAVVFESASKAEAEAKDVVRSWEWLD